MHCTPVSAYWCPVHGDCTCERLPDGDCAFDGRDCPLHSGASSHAETIESAQVEEMLRELARDCGVELSENDRGELRRFGQYLFERSRKAKHGKGE